MFEGHTHRESERDRDRDRERERERKEMLQGGKSEENWMFIHVFI